MTHVSHRHLIKFNLQFFEFVSNDSSFNWLNEYTFLVTKLIILIFFDILKSGKLIQQKETIISLLNNNESSGT